MPPRKPGDVMTLPYHCSGDHTAVYSCRSGNVRKSVRSSLINPLVDKNQLLHSANEAADVARKLVIPFQVQHRQLQLQLEDRSSADSF